MLRSLINWFETSVKNAWSCCADKNCVLLTVTEILGKLSVYGYWSLSADVSKWYLKWANDIAMARDI